MIVDPFQFLLDGFRRMRGGAEHAEAAGTADRRHHVAAVAEGQQGKFNSEHLADGRFHRCVYSRGSIFCAAHCWLDVRSLRRRYRIMGGHAKSDSDLILNSGHWPRGERWAASGASWLQPREVALPAIGDDERSVTQNIRCAFLSLSVAGEVVVFL